MSRLYLHCDLCGRKQADGLLSRGFWGHLELDDGRALRACPTCKQQYLDWDSRLRASVSGRVSGFDESGFRPQPGPFSA